jgi:hypothetical protein
MEIRDYLTETFVLFAALCLHVSHNKTMKSLQPFEHPHRPERHCRKVAFSKSLIGSDVRVKSFFFPTETILVWAQHSDAQQ